jgi:hypothetical protein
VNRSLENGTGRLGVRNEKALVEQTGGVSSAMVGVGLAIVDSACQHKYI